MFRLDGKTAIITGGASGIGEQTVRQFIEQGARVAIADISPDNAIRLAAELGPNAFGIRMDVGSQDSVNEALQAAIDAFGKIDILVNNAGIGLVGDVEKTSDEDFDRLMKVNVSGVFHCCKALVPHMLASGAGNIINIGSVAGLVGIEQRFAYSATKGAVVAITRQLAVDYVSKNIRVNCICPGTVYTPFVDSYLQKFHSHEIEETKAKEIICQIISGYLYMAKKGILHRDLKPANIMRHGNTWKIGDFGFATSCKTDFFFDKLNVGTPLYMPP